MMSLLLRRDNLTEFDVGLQKLLKKQNSELVLMEPWAYSTAAIFLFFIGFFGFSFNLTAIILMCKDIQIWTPMNLILLNLVSSDFSVAILGNPFTFVATLHRGWSFSKPVCHAYGFFMSLLGISSITTLTVLSYERYSLISCPFATHLSSGGAKMAILLIWLYSFLVTGPPLFGWGEYVTEAANISCSVNWEVRTPNATSYIIYLFFFGLVLPLIIILYSYLNIILTMRKSTIRMGRVNQAEKKVTMMVGLMILAFLVAWIPYAVFALVEQFGDPELISPALAILPALIAKSSICYNPVIYVGMNTQFRAAWLRIFKKQDKNASFNENLAETTCNQLSITSSRISIECTSFTKFEKRRKKLKVHLQHEKKLKKMMAIEQLNEKITITSEKKSKNNNAEPKNDYELSIIQSGKHSLIRKDSYQSNVC